MNNTGAGTSVPSSSIEKNGTKVPTPEGYKQTNVGVIPEDWEVVKLGKIIILLTDYHANGAYKKLKENVELLSSEDYAIMIRTTNFEKNNFINNLIYINEKAYTFLKKSKVYENDIIINKIANAGATYLMPKLDKPVSLAMNLFLLRLDNEVNKNFVYIQIKQREKYLKILSSGTTTKTITKNDVRGFEIPLPPLKEQQKIAQILITWDNAISKQEALILAKEELKKGLMQNLLSGEIRFDGFDGEWKQIKLKQLINDISIKNKNKEINLVLTVSRKHGFISQKNYFEREIASKDTSNYKIVNSGNFAYNPSRINIGSISYLEEFEKGILSPMYVIFKCNDKLENRYFDYWLNTHAFKGNLSKYLSGSVRESLSFKDMSLMKIKLPSLKEQQKVAEVLTLADKEIDLLKNELETLKEQKRGLMQRLLSGEVRVKV